jgi:hypothetical protein
VLAPELARIEAQVRQQRAGLLRGRQRQWLTVLQHFEVTQKMQFECGHARTDTPVTACFQDILDKTDKNHGHSHGGFIDTG